MKFLARSIDEMEFLLRLVLQLLKNPRLIALLHFNELK